MNNKLYQEILMDHFKNPRNHIPLKNSNFTLSDDNPSCGDKITIEGVVSNGILKEVAFSGKGCVLSQATASMLTEKCRGQSVEFILSLSVDDILNMIHMSLGPNRLKCALLPLQVLKDGVASVDEAK